MCGTPHPTATGSWVSALQGHQGGGCLDRGGILPVETSEVTAVHIGVRSRRGRPARHAAVAELVLPPRRSGTGRKRRRRPMLPARGTATQRGHKTVPKRTPTPHRTGVPLRPRPLHQAKLGSGEPGHYIDFRILPQREKTHWSISPGVSHKNWVTSELRNRAPLRGFRTTYE